MFEATRRGARCLLIMLVVSLMILLVTPMLRPFRWSRLLLTYVLPAIPLAALVDGLVSCLRTYTPDELRALAAPRSWMARAVAVVSGATHGQPVSRRRAWAR